MRIELPDLVDVNDCPAHFSRLLVAIILTHAVGVIVRRITQPPYRRCDANLGLWRSRRSEQSSRPLLIGQGC